MSEKTPKATPETNATTGDEPRQADPNADVTVSEEQTPLEEATGIDVESVADGLAADLESLQAELQEARDRALRSSAELENFRRRAYRQMEEERRYANLDLLRDVLPVWDNMGRAVEAAEKAGETDVLLEGFKMVCTQLECVFERYDCVRIDALGEPFDPHLHEAISQLPSADHPAGTVLHVTQVGFRLHDRVVRPCQVVVSAAPPGSSERSQASGEPDCTEKDSQESPQPEQE